MKKKEKKHDNKNMSKMLGSYNIFAKHAKSKDYCMANLQRLT